MVLYNFENIFKNLAEHLNIKMHAQQEYNRTNRKTLAHHN